MCTYYEVPGREQLVLHFGDVPEEEWRDKMSPLYRGPFLRAKGEAVQELVVGQWGMIPPHSKTHIPTGKDGKRLSTVKWGIVGRMIWAWVLTIPVTALLGYGFERLLLPLLD